MYRWVFLTKNYAIKVPRPLMLFGGIKSNINEVRVYRKTKDERLCPVLWWLPFGLLVVMPRCEHVQPHLHRDRCFEDGYVKPEHRAEEYGEDDHCGNYGLLNGRFVKMDYGGRYRFRY